MRIDLTLVATLASVNDRSTECRWLSDTVPHTGLPGKTLNTALALWWLSGMKNHNEVKMSKQALAYFDVSDDAYRDALSRLEKARLVTVRRQPGQRAWVKINHAAQAASQGIDLQAGESVHARRLGLPPRTGHRADHGSGA
jgi:hypothetical protein